MKRVRVSELVPGMKTAEDVYSFNNQLVVEKGVLLSDSVIARLEYYSVLSIRVEEDTDEKPSPSQEPLHPVSKDYKDTSDKLSYSERIKSTKQFREFQQNFVENTEALKGHLHDIIEKQTADTDAMLGSVSDLISKGMTTIGMFDMLHNMRSYDDLTYVHSMSVSLICNIFGRWLSISNDDLQVLTLAGLLHDIGKIAIPENIIKKPSKLTNDEYNKIKQHTVEGYKLLQSMPLDGRIKDAALLHHERCDGMGYPLGIKADRIPAFAKIVAIADVYDAMTAARVYRGPMCPFKVISIFEDEGLQKYDSHYILTFLQNIGQTYVNNRVRLNDGREGDIVLIHANSVSRPLMKLMDGTFLDLENEDKKKIYIETLV